MQERAPTTEQSTRGGANASSNNTTAKTDTTKLKSIPTSSHQQQVPAIVASTSAGTVNANNTTTAAALTTSKQTSTATTTSASTRPSSAASMSSGTASLHPTKTHKRVETEATAQSSISAKTTKVSNHASTAAPLSPPPPPSQQQHHEQLGTVSASPAGSYSSIPSKKVITDTHLQHSPVPSLPSQSQQQNQYNQKYHQQQHICEQSSLQSIESDIDQNQQGQTNIGIFQGLELLERQQLKKERFEQQQLERKRRAAMEYQHQQLSNRSHNNNSNENAAVAATTNNRNMHPTIPLSMNHTHPNQYYSQVMSNQNYGPQDNQNFGIPRTVHLSGDDDDVSYSLKDETLSFPLQAGNRDGGKNNGRGMDNDGSGKVESSGGMKRVNSIGKFLKTPLKSTLKRTISDRFFADPNADNVNSNNDNASLPTNGSNNTAMKPILYGYLHKLGRNGKWQKRYFESDGTYLLYYKNKERKKLLATLDLLHVGRIQLDTTDPAGCTFKIEVKGRDYYLCADTKERARDWVITLNRVKEARMQIGGLSLIEPFFEGRGNDIVNGGASKSDAMSKNQTDSNQDVEDDQVAPRIVMVAARQRTKGLGKDDFNELENSLAENNNAMEPLPSQGHSPGSGSLGSNPNSPKHLGRPPINLVAAGHAMQQSVKVRWKKNRNAMQNWTRRLSRWAKRMTMIRCIIQDDVVYLNPQQQQQQQQQQHLQKLHIQEHDDSEVSCLGELEAMTNRHPKEEESFIDLGAPSYSSYSELYAENRQGRQVNLSEASLESIDTAAYHAVKSAPTRSTTAWKPSHANRKQESVVEEEVDVGGNNIT